MSGLLVPTADDWRILDRMRGGEHLYINNVGGAPWTWSGNLSNNRDTLGTGLSSRTLNSLIDGHWIVYDEELNECVLTSDGSEVVRRYHLTTSNKVVKKKRGEY
jgi:hypothetical protein